mmetsp:Transcript_25741/g.62000  ORF Transcript_25741/g.62000 Transcript_25741/m.62000 type:complete len:101 (+) Transcript_25741:479-781(+)
MTIAIAHHNMSETKLFAISSLICKKIHQLPSSLQAVEYHQSGGDSRDRLFQHWMAFAHLGDVSDLCNNGNDEKMEKVKKRTAAATITTTSDDDEILRKWS